MGTPTNRAEVEYAHQPVEQCDGDPSAECQAASPLVWRALELARRGDRDAAGFLYARYSDEVCECARAVVEDTARAGDVTRSVFASLGGEVEWPSPHIVSPLRPGSSPQAWLLAWALRTALGSVASD